MTLNSEQTPRPRGHFNNTYSDDEEWPELPQGLRRRGGKSLACQVCGSITHEYEHDTNIIRCGNCAESASSNASSAIRLERPPVAPQPPPPLSIRTPRVDAEPPPEEPEVTTPVSPTLDFASLIDRFVVFPFRSTFAYLFNRLHRLTYVSTFLSDVYLPILLYLPIYYISSAADVIKLSTVCKADYEQWVHSSPRTTNLNSPPANADIDTATVTVIFEDPNTPVQGNANRAGQVGENGSAIEMDAFTTTSAEIAEPHPNIAHFSRQNTLPSLPDVTGSQTHASSDIPESVSKLQQAWINYIDTRVWEWQVLLGISSLAVGAAVATFQIPEASADLLIRTFISLSLFRAILGVFFAPLLCIYFNSQHYTRSVHFAMLWSQEANGGAKVNWRPWIMLSLPAITTLWSILFFAFAMLMFIWRTGSALDSSPIDGNDVSDQSASSTAISFIIRSLLTSWMALDVGCGVWTFRRMAWFKKEVQRIDGNN